MGASARGGLGVGKLKVRGPLHDPEADGAVILYLPPKLTVQEAIDPKVRDKHPVAGKSCMGLRLCLPSFRGERCG